MKTQYALHDFENRTLRLQQRVQRGDRGSPPTPWKIWKPGGGWVQVDQVLPVGKQFF
jgi:hypothetical protein